MFFFISVKLSLDGFRGSLPMFHMKRVNAAVTTPFSPNMMAPALVDLSDLSKGQ